MLGPLLARLLALDPPSAALVAGGGCVVAITIVLLGVPESRPPGSASVGRWCSDDASITPYTASGWFVITIAITMVCYHTVLCDNPTFNRVGCNLATACGAVSTVLQL